MKGPQIEPHRITKPFQLLAVWFAGLIILVGIFLGAATRFNDPTWIRPLLVISAVVIVPVFVGLIFVLQTKFRPQLQDDPYFSGWLKSQKKVFAKFRAENFGVRDSLPPRSNQRFAVDVALESRRIQRYQETRGLFLVHSWRPSLTSGQVADIVIRLQQHGNGPLLEGTVKCVEYTLGPKFFSAPVKKENAKDAFQLEVSAYGPMLCLAKVFFTDGSDPLELERYVNFDGA